MNKLLTIVVPVYKVEPYINKCLDSCVLTDENLMSQLEVIIVNDGTPDNSAEMSREYVKRYPNTFRQIDKKNGGHGSAWNVGLKEATGKFLRFLDSDDWLTNLDKLMLKLQETDADLVFTHRNTYYAGEGRDNISYFEPPYNHTVDTNSLSVDRFVELHFYAGFQSCTYKTSLLQPYYPLFSEGTRYDDSILTILPIVVGKTYITYDFVVYNYLIGREEQTCARSALLKNCEQHNAEYGKMHNFVTNTDISRVREQVDALMYRAFSDTMTLAIELPYIRRKKCIAYLKRYIPHQGTWKYSKQIQRYLRYPFVVAFAWDAIRSLKNKKG